MILARDRHRLSALLLVPLAGLIRGDPLFFCFPLVFILIVCRIAMPATHFVRVAVTASVRFGLALLVIALSLMPLIKSTYGIASVAIGALASALLMVRGQKMLAMSGALLFVAGISTFWVVAGQPLTQLPAFFVSQGQIVSGYTDAMSLLGPVWEPIIYIVACCLLGLFHFGLFWSTGLSGVALAVGIALLLFMAFKAGFVRHDAHAGIAAGFLGLTGWILMIGRPGGRPVLALVVCFTTWAIIDHHYTGLSIWTIKDRVVQPFLESASGLVTRMEGNGALRKKFDESLRAIRAQQPLPPLKGTTDIYSFGQSALLANGLEWAPRPVLQSYSAYTTVLLEKDAAYLASEAAPDNVLFTVQPMRLPSLEDGLSWPSLLTRYEPAALIGDMAVLHRRLKPTSDGVVREPAIASGSYGLGEEISLPTTTGALWAKIEIKPTFWGKIISVLSLLSGNFPEGVS